MLRFSGLENPGKRHRSWKTLEKSWNSKVVVLYFTFWFKYRSLEKNCNAVTSKTDLVCTIFDLMQPCLWTECNLESPWKRIFWVLENPGIWSLRVLESPGKHCFNVCTNPEKLSSLHSPSLVILLYVDRADTMTDCELSLLQQFNEIVNANQQHPVLVSSAPALLASAAADPSSSITSSLDSAPAASLVDDLFAVDMLTRMRGNAHLDGRPFLPPSECYWVVNASPLNCGWWVGHNFGTILAVCGPKYTKLSLPVRECP